VVSDTMEKSTGGAQGLAFLAEAGMHVSLVSGRGQVVWMLNVSNVDTPLLIMHWLHACIS
jgi:hypothetical protein